MLRRTADPEPAAIRNPVGQHERHMLAKPPYPEHDMTLVRQTGHLLSPPGGGTL